MAYFLSRELTAENELLGAVADIVVEVLTDDIAHQPLIHYAEDRL